MNLNESVLGKSKKSKKVAYIICVVIICILFIILIGLDTIGTSFDLLIIMLFCDILFILGMIIAIRLLLRLPNDMIVYNYDTYELKVRQGKTIKETNKPIIINIEDVLSVTCEVNYIGIYKLFKVKKHKYIKIVIKDETIYYIYNVEFIEEATQDLYQILLDKKENM